MVGFLMMGIQHLAYMKQTVGSIKKIVFLYTVEVLTPSNRGDLITNNQKHSVKSCHSQTNKPHSDCHSEVEAPFSLNVLYGVML